MELCTKTYDQKCIIFTNINCTNYIDSYFVFNGKECIKSLDNCIEHYYDRVIKNCTLCKEDHYCINNNKCICSYISPEEIDTFYKIDNHPNPCREKCYKKFRYCDKCDENWERYTKCIDIAILFDNGTCYIDHHLIHRGNC